MLISCSLKILIHIAYCISQFSFRFSSVQFSCLGWWQVEACDLWQA